MGQALSPPGAEASIGAAAAPSGRNYDKEMEIAFWHAVKDSKSPAVLKTYLDRFPKGTFAGLARVLLEEAAKGSRIAVAPANPAAPPNTASISSATPDAGAAGPEAAAVTKDPRALARALQTELKRVGCDPGPVDGQLGPAGRRGAQRLCASHQDDAAARSLAGGAASRGRAAKARLCVDLRSR